MLTLEPVAHIHSDFPTKFGIPRQSGLVEELEAQILSLETMPYRCAERRTGAYAGKDYRQLFVKNYTVIFRIDEKEKQVIIVTVRYSRSQF